jgi:hypothetical protein
MNHGPHHDLTIRTQFGKCAYILSRIVHRQTRWNILVTWSKHSTFTHRIQKYNIYYLQREVESHTRKTERRGRVVNTSTSYSGVPVLNSRHRRPAILIEAFRGFPQSLQATAGIIP